MNQKNCQARLKHHQILRPVGPRGSEQFRDQGKADDQGRVLDEGEISSAGHMQMYLQAESHLVPRVNKFPCLSQLQ